MAAQPEYFYSYYIKNLKLFFLGSNKKNEFSEGLLRTLCYETDIGPIPRGIDLDVSMNKPKYMDSTNWNFPIQGCYWCSDDKKDLFGICCSKDCLFYFHDWCIGRVEFLTQRKFCRFPGCDKACMTNSYCDTTHRDEFGKSFPQWVDQESLTNKILRNGPSWYDFKSIDYKPTINHPESQPEPNTNFFLNDKSKTSEHSQNKFPGKIKVSENPDKYIPIEFRDYLIFQTDVGIIPREKPSEQQLASPYSIYPNWKKEIRGCYCCGDKLSASTGNSYVCSYSCYLIFYEWCRRKIKSFTGITLCKFPGCLKPAQTGFDYCNNEHAQKTEDEYARIKKQKNIEKLVERDPDWYIPHHIGNPTKQPVTAVNAGTGDQYKPETPHNQNPTSFFLKNSKPEDVTTCSSIQFKTRWEDILKRRFEETKPYMIVPFSEILLKTLYSGTDIGYIPRGIDSENVTVPIYENSNWKKDIIGCYWCGNKSTYVQGICCGNDCIFYFHEWCVERAGMLHQRRFCKLPGCESVYSSQSKDECCSAIHREKYMRDFLTFHDRDKLKKQLSLGPSWYDNITHKSDSSHNQAQTSSSTVQPDFSKAKMRLSEELSTALLFYTDVGPIPRSYRLSGDSSSQYSAHANWNRQIEGCYLCKQRTSDNEYLCSGRCYLIFHEWCRLKVHKHTKNNYCEQPRCKHKSRPDVSTCSDTHFELLLDNYKRCNLTFSEFHRLVIQGPYWYDNSETSNNVTSDSSKTGATFKSTGAPTSDP